jgi:membrane-associated protease RseP (regulator of RpoE activity)
MIHLVLFLATVLTTLLVGAMYAGADVFSNPLLIVRGAPYSAALLSILGAHELAHFFACKRHHVQATLPYFIPVPPPFLLGTMGAVIKMRPPFANRNTILDIGIAGPLAGAAVAIPIVIIGLARSTPVATTELPETALMLGNSLLFAFLQRVALGALPEGTDVLLGPVAFAGWIGLLVTMFNLLPAGQLDGGHIFYSLFPRWHRGMSRLLVLVLLAMGFFVWRGWLIWAGILLLIGARHPAPLDPDRPITRRRRRLALIALALFIVTFVPAPLTITFGRSEQALPEAEMTVETHDHAHVLGADPREHRGRASTEGILARRHRGNAVG